MQAQPHDEPLPERLLFYDGVCGLCNGVVRIMLRADRKRLFHYAPLQGETLVRAKQSHPDIPEGLDTFVYLERGRVLVRSRAVAAVAKHLPFPWGMARVLGWMPRFLGDAFYRLVAKTRYRLFGKHDACQVPSPEVRERFLP